MAFLRKEKQKSGTYLSICENYRDDSGKVKQKILYRLGKLEQYTADALQRIASQLLLLSGGNLEEHLRRAVKELARYNYGFPLVVKRILHTYGFEKIFERIKNNHKLSFNPFDVLLLLICDRLNDPLSKLGSYKLQNDYIGIEELSLQHIYRTLDKLSDYNNLIQKHIYEKNKTLFNYEVDLVFYDVTTFYFDSEREEENTLRQMGFSKDGKIGQTQILFGLLIDKNKNPIGYRIYSGNKYEGHTFKEAIDRLKTEYSIKNIIVVADRGMMNKANIALFEKEELASDYDYIIGERLKVLPTEVKEYLIELKNYRQTNWQIQDGEEITLCYTTYNYNGKTLIGSYSKTRAAKDRHDRERLLEKAERIKSHPELVEKKAKRYYLKNVGDAVYEIDEEKIKRAERFDGFTVIATNRKELKPEEALERYKDLYKIEQSFRTFKSYIEARPMFHWTDKRIEGHMCMCYVSYCLLNYLSQVMKANRLESSENKISRILTKMQLSLIQQGTNQYYLRSSMDLETEELLKTLKIHPLNDITPKSLIYNNL